MLVGPCFVVESPAPVFESLVAGGSGSKSGNDFESLDGFKGALGVEDAGSDLLVICDLSEASV